MTWMLYGVTGYTGRLVLEAALARGHRPVLAGRDAAAVAALAAPRGLDYRVFDLRDPDAVAAQLSGVDAVAHCAGPFSATAEPMVRGCLRAGAHYLDITGEIDVFEAVYARDEEARRAGVVLLPGAGMDVVPTDCLGALVAEQVPGARRLDLAIRTSGRLSPGTLKSAWEGVALGGRARLGGELRTVPVGWRRRDVDFPSGRVRVASLPWGDVSSAYRSTGIGEITTYTRLPGAGGRGAALLQRLAATGPVQRLGRAALGALVRGPDAAARARSHLEVYAEASAADGTAVAATLRGPDPYDFTADSLVRLLQRLLAGAAPAGAHTPATAFGHGFVRELDGVTVSDPAPVPAPRT
ncbi:saccharopine dehydrogenase family protein [Salinifilum ghardaiensis]